MSFGVTRINPLGDGNWVMEFFDARTEYTFAELLSCLRTLGAPFEEAPDPPPEGFRTSTSRNGIELIAGFSDEYGCHLICSSKEVLAELSELTQAWKG